MASHLTLTTPPWKSSLASLVDKLRVGLIRPSAPILRCITVWDPSSILLLMKYRSLAGGFEGGEVQFSWKMSPTLYLPSGVGWVVSTGGEEGGWITVRSVLSSTVLNLGASELTSHM